MEETTLVGGGAQYRGPQVLGRVFLFGPFGPGRTVEFSDSFIWRRFDGLVWVRSGRQLFSKATRCRAEAHGRALGGPSRVGHWVRRIAATHGGSACLKQAVECAVDQLALRQPLEPLGGNARLAQ